MPTARVYELANLFRQLILQRERSAATAMVRYYGTIWQGMQEEKSAIIRDLMERRTAWERTWTDGSSEATQDSAEALYQLKANELRRLRTWQGQIEGEMAKFADYASADIIAQKRSAIELAKRSAEAMINASFPTQAGITAAHMHMNPQAVEALVAQLADGSPLDTVIRKYTEDAVEAFGTKLVEAITRGWNPEKTARELRSAFGVGLSNALRVSRTEQMRAYRIATQQTYQANSDVLKGWYWLAAKSGNTCAACLMMDGTFHTLDEILEDHPNGRCTMSPATKSFEELGIDAPEPQYQPETGREWFEGQPEDVQRRILGNSKFEAWKAGAFKLEDIPQYRADATWGGSWVPKSNMELFGAHRWVSEVVEGGVTASGAPVSNALDIMVSTGNPLHGTVNHAISLIDSVHGDGSLPEVVLYEDIMSPMLGSYNAYQDGRTESIRFRGRSNPTPTYTIVHEVGHFIDHQGIGKPGEFVDLSYMKDWYIAVQQTDAVGRLRDMQPGDVIGTSEFRGTVQEIKVNPDYKNYLLSSEELWARSYAQYIGVKSGDEALLAELRELQDPARPYPSQWQDDDFAPVVQAIDAMFKELGWLK